MRVSVSESTQPKTGLWAHHQENRRECEGGKVMTKLFALSQKSHKGMFVKVDDDIYEQIKGQTWRLDSSGYPMHQRQDPPVRIPGQKVKRITTMLHHLVIGKKPGMTVDHINRDPLDNRRENLRHCTLSQNLHNQGPTKNNTTGYKGVVYNKKDKRYRASIKYNWKTYHLGSYMTAEEAARAYDEGAKRIVGEYAYINFPDYKAKVRIIK